MESRDRSPLDNPVWHALTGPLRGFAVSGMPEGVMRMDPEVGIFWALERFDAASWERLADAVGVGGFCGLVHGEIGTLPEGWTAHHRGGLVQMVAGEVGDPGRSDFEVLGPGDFADMLELATSTRSSPFLPRTGELGGYLGWRDEGRLLAMAGRRFRVPGFAEVSAVSTHPDARRRGFATALTLTLVQRIRERGEEAFLHVEASNESAWRLYRALGFVERRRLEVAWLEWSGRDA